MPVEITKLSTPEISTLPRERTAFFYLVGPVENFGPHLPTGTGLAATKDIANRVAERVEKELNWKVIWMPSAGLGISVATGWGIKVRGHVLRDWLVDSAGSLLKLGFRHFVVFSSNLAPRQLTAIEEAGNVLKRKGSFWGKRKHQLLSASSALVDWKTVLKSPILYRPNEHGGKTDTSIALAIKENVNPQYRALENEKANPTQFASDFLGQTSRQSYVGTPKEANAEFGEKEIADRAEKIFRKLETALSRPPGDKLFRSGYLLFPPNWSFFKAWILLIMSLLFLSGWVWLVTRSFPV